MLTWIQIERMLRAAPEGKLRLSVLADPHFDADDAFPLGEKVYIAYIYEGRFVSLYRNPVRKVLVRRVSTFLASRGLSMRLVSIDGSGFDAVICKL